MCTWRKRWLVNKQHFLLTTVGTMVYNPKEAPVQPGMPAACFLLSSLRQTRCSLPDKMYRTFFLLYPVSPNFVLHVSPMYPKHMYNVSTLCPVSQCTFHCCSHFLSSLLTVMFINCQTAPHHTHLT